MYRFLGLRFGRSLEFRLASNLNGAISNFRQECKFRQEVLCFEHSHQGERSDLQVSHSLDPKISGFHS